MKKQILSNLASNYALSFVGMALGFVLVPFLINRLGKETYGVIVLAESVIVFFEILTVSVRQAMSRHAAFAYAKGRMDEFVEYLSTSLRILLVAATIVLVFGTLLSVFFPVLFKVPLGRGEQSQWNFFLITCAFALSALNIPYWSALYAKERFDLINISSSFGLVLRAVCLFAFFSLAPPAWRMLTAYGVIYLAMTLGHNGFIRFWFARHFPGLRFEHRHFSAAKVREILSFSTHTSLSRVSTLLYQSTANILINVFWGPSMNTVYSVALKLPNIFHRIFVEPAYTLTPTFTTLAARNERDKVQRLFRSYSKFLAAATYPALWTMILLSHPIIRRWVGPDLALAGDLMPLYLLPLFVSTPSSLSGSIMNAYAKVRLPSFVSFTTAVANLALCVVLGVVADMRLFGIAAASVTTIIGSSLLFYPVYACRIAGIPVRDYYLHSVLKPLSLSALMLPGSLLLLRHAGGLRLEGLDGLAVLAPMSLLYYFAAYRLLFEPSEKALLGEILRTLRGYLGGPKGQAGKAPRGEHKV